jgi:hypothetical protein
MTFAQSQLPVCPSSDSNPEATWIHLSKMPTRTKPLGDYTFAKAARAISP